MIENILGLLLGLVINGIIITVCIWFARDINKYTEKHK